MLFKQNGTIKKENEEKSFVSLNISPDSPFMPLSYFIYSFQINFWNDDDNQTKSYTGSGSMRMSFTNFFDFFLFFQISLFSIFRRLNSVQRPPHVSLVVNEMTLSQRHRHHWCSILFHISPLFSTYKKFKLFLRSFLFSVPLES